MNQQIHQGIASFCGAGTSAYNGFIKGVKK